MAIIKCLTCNSMISDQDKVCPTCGSAVVKKMFCPRCGGALTDKHVHCMHCGADICPKCKSTNVEAFDIMSGKKQVQSGTGQLKPAVF